MLPPCIHCSQRCYLPVFTALIGATSLSSLLSEVLPPCSHCSQRCYLPVFTPLRGATSLSSLLSDVLHPCLHSSQRCYLPVFTPLRLPPPCLHSSQRCYLPVFTPLRDAISLSSLLSEMLSPCLLHSYQRCYLLVFTPLRGATSLSSLLTEVSSTEVFFGTFFWRARVCRPLLRLCRPFMIFEGCLDSNPECCGSKLACYRLSHPSLYLATHPSA